MVPGYQNGRVNTLRLWSAAGDRRVRPARSSTPATTKRPSARRRSPRTSPRCSTPRTPPRRARSCACSSSTSSWRARSRDFLDRVLRRRTSTCTKLPEPRHLPAQRHPPGHRGARAHARARRREGHGVGGRVGDHPAVLRLHVPHAAARGARGLVGRAARPPAAAPPRDHLPHQRRLPRCRSASASATTSCASATCRSSASTRSARCGWPTSRPSPARRSTASPSCTRSCCATRCCPTSTSSSRASSPTSPTASRPRRFVRLANPCAVGAHHRRARRGLGHRPRSGCASSSPTPKTRSSARGSAEVKAANKRRLSERAARARRLRGQPTATCST